MSITLAYAAFHMKDENGKYYTVNYDRFTNIWYVREGCGDQRKVLVETRVRQFVTVTRAKQILTLWKRQNRKLKFPFDQPGGYNKRNQHPDFD